MFSIQWKSPIPIFPVRCPVKNIVSGVATAPCSLYTTPLLYSLTVHKGTQGRWVPLGDSLAIIKQHKASFTVVRFPNPLATGSDIHGNWGTWLVFRGLSEFHPTFSLYIPPSQYIPNLKSKTVFCYNLNSDLKACQAGGVCMNQSTMCATTYIFALIKSTHLPTH